MKKLISLLLTVALLLSTLPMTVSAIPVPVSDTAASTEGYYGPGGKFLAPIEAPDPGAIPIYTAEDLDNIRKNMAGSYVLMNDIDLTGFNYGQWKPIGDLDNPFKGVFDGQGHVIKNMAITGSYYSGLFGETGDTTIKNLGMEDIRIENAANAGSILATGGVVLIYNCYNEGGIIINGRNAGGICSNIGNGSVIAYCYNTGSITAAEAGGICRHCYSVTIKNCFNTGDITGAYSSALPYLIGGILATGSSASISNCYNTGDIFAVSLSSNARAGGITTDIGTISNCFNTGNIYVDNQAIAYAAGISCTSGANNCYNTGDIDAVSSRNASLVRAGGIICDRSISKHVVNSLVFSGRIYAENTANPSNASSYLIGNLGSYDFNSANNLALEKIEGNAIDDSNGRITRAQAEKQDTYEKDLGWDFADVWQMVPGYKYPQLQGLPPAGPPSDDYPFTVQVVNTNYSGLNYNGQRTLVSAFQVRANEDDLILKNVQGLRLAYDNSVLQLLKWDASAVITGVGFDDPVSGAGNSGVLGGSLTVYNAISADGNTGYLSLNAGDSDSSFACPPDEFVALGEVRFALREGKSAADLRDDSIRIMLTGELAALNQAFSVLINAAPELSFAYGSQKDGIAQPDWDNLAEPEIIWILADRVSVSGMINSYNPLNPTNVRLMEGGIVVYELDIDPTGLSGWSLLEQSFCFEDVAPGTYELLITKDVHSKFTVRNLAIGDDDVDLTLDSRPEVQALRLRCGDINDDGLINDADLSILWRSGNYNKKVGDADNDRCDLNGDGLINDADLTILWQAYNYNRGAIVIDY